MTRFKCVRHSTHTRNQIMKLTLAAGAVGLAVVVRLSGPAAARQQVADLQFDTTVSRPAYARSGPAVLIDAGHQNFHTADGL